MASTTKTVRYYEEVGVPSPPTRTSGGLRRSDLETSTGARRRKPAREAQGGD
jgi:DNA-binding transcriptional MerR regulator